jgi:hypothetical protein
VKKNRLENHKIFPVWFDFGFQSLKPIEPNRTGPVQLSWLLKKKRSINNIFSNPKLKSPFSLSQPLPLAALCLSSLKSVSFFSMLFVSHLSSQTAREYAKKDLRIPVLRLSYYKIL